MEESMFNEGVRPGGLTTKNEIRILLCTILDSVSAPVTKQQLEEILLGEELVNYFVMAESLSQLLEQKLATGNDIDGYSITESGHTVALTLAQDIPKTVRDAAIRGVIRAQQYAAKQAAHHCEVVKGDTGYSVRCSIGDVAGPLFQLELYMPDELSAKAVQSKFVDSGDETYKLVLAALTSNRELAAQALAALSPPGQE